MSSPKIRVAGNRLLSTDCKVDLADGLDSDADAEQSGQLSDHNSLAGIDSFSPFDASTRSLSATTDGYFNIKPVSISRLQSNEQWATPSSSSFDPFSSASIEINADIHTVLQYYLDFAIMGAYRVEALAMPQPAHHHRNFALVRAVVRTGLSNDTLLYSVLAVTAARMSHIIHNSDRYAKLADYFMFRAVQGLRQSLSQNDAESACKDILIQSVFHLCTAEWYRHNFATSAMHMSVLKQLVGKHYTSPALRRDARFTKDLIGVYDTFMAVETGGKPSFALDWQPPPFSMDKRKEINSRLARMLTQGQRRQRVWGRLYQRSNITEEDRVQRISRPFVKPVKHASDFQELVEDLALSSMKKGHARGFRGAAETGIFSTRLTKLIIEDFVPWQKVSAICFMTEYADMDEAEWVSKTGIAILHHLLSMSSELPEGPTLREAATRTALIICLCHICSPLAWRSVKLNLKQLQATLQANEAVVTFKEAYCPSVVEGELTLWILNIGLAISPADAEAEWFASRSAIVAVYLGINSFEKMFDLMAKFMLARLMHQKRMIDLVNRIVRSPSTPLDD